MTAASQWTFPPSDNPALGLAGEFVVSNSATALMPWKQPGRVGRWNVAKGFNSATALMPWKHPGDNDTKLEPWQLQFGHGFDAVETSGTAGWGRLPEGFNSATALMPWKYLLGQLADGFRALQCGHGFDAVETPRVPSPFRCKAK